jgi:hypothetical protein
VRSGRSLLVLLVVALGLGAYIYFVEWNRDPGAADKKAKVFAVESTDIEKLEVRSANGETTKLEKAGDDWKIVGPAAMEADQSSASAIADALSSAEIQSVLQESATAIAPFGLEPARVSVAFHKKGDATEYRLNVGKKDPTGGDLYAQVAGQPKLLLLQGFLDDTLNRTTFDLRNKKVLTFDRDTVDHIILQSAAAPTVDLAKDGGDWKITAPIAARADFSPIDGLIGRLGQVQMTAIVHDGSEPTAADLKTFGLDKPRLVATLGAKSTRAALAIGADKDDTSVYARDLARPLVFTVEKALLTDLQKQPADLRIKDVFQFKSYTAVGLDVTTDGATASFAKSASTAEAKEGGPDVWKQTAPTAKDVNATAMADFLNTVSSLRADSFVATVPSSGQDMLVVARFGTAAAPTEERVTLRKVGTTVYAISGKDPGAAVVPSADFDKATTQFKDITGTK